MLTASDCANAKPGAKPYKLADAYGLFLLVHPNGGKYWRLKYGRPGTRTEAGLAFGTYPTISLAKAVVADRKLTHF